MPAGLDACGGRRYRAQREKRGCRRSRRTSATQGRARRRGGAQNRRRLSTDGGAPGTVRPTTCGECFRIANTSSVIRRKGRRGRRPLRWIVAWDDGLRYCAAPTLPQPLSHGPTGRDSSPFRGAEGWVEICGVYACVYHDADTYVSLPLVRGGVLDAPRLRECRGGMVADVRRGQLHPRFLRRAR